MPVNITGIIISSQHATRYYTINNWTLCEQAMQRPSQPIQTKYLRYVVY